MAKSWSECNKPHRLTMEFLGTIGKDAFAGGRPTLDFYRVYSFFKKVDASVLDLFHEYMADPHLTMRRLFQDAPAWNQRQRTANVEETHVEDYLQLLKEW